MGIILATTDGGGTWNPQSSATERSLNQKALEQGLSSLEARVMDGNALDLNDGTFDVACSQWGIMLFPDRRKALLEMVRVTRPGGKGVMVVFGPPQQVQIFWLFFQALATAIPGFTPPQNSPLFCLQDPQDLRREMEEAGFRDVQVETQEHPFEFQSGDHLWNTMEFSAPATAGLLRQFASEQQVAARRALGELLRAQYGDGPASNRHPCRYRREVRKVSFNPRFLTG